MSKEKEVILNIGVPGSGKSTWTLEFIEKNPGWVKVSRDDFRYMLRNSPMLDVKGENILTGMIFDTARKALRGGFNVIVDNTHCKLKYINQAIEELGDVANISYRYFDTPLATCIERDSKRERKVGETIIKRMHNDLKILADTFNFQPTRKKDRIKLDYEKNWDPKLPYAIISDIDGTVAAMNGKRGPFEWHRVGVDDMDIPVIENLKLWKSIKTFRGQDLKLIMASGRDASCRKETEGWLRAAEIPFDMLFMRPENDYRKDSLIKKEIYEREIQGKYNVIMVFDDRDQVVELWRSLGLKCIQVEPGDF